MAMNSFSIEGIPIAYLDEGRGPLVILAHCSSASHRIWRSLIDDLKSRYRVLAPDLIGYGDSGRWPPDRPFDARADAKILIELARLAGEPAHFVGHSYGGAMVLDALRSLSKPARAITLIEPVAFPLLRAAERMDEWRTVEQIADGVIEAMSRGDRQAAAKIYMGFWLGRIKWWLAPQKLKQNVLETVDKVALEFQIAKDLEPPPLDELRSLNPPALLIYGTRTRKPAKAVIEILDDLLPVSQVKAISGVGHMSPITHRDQVNAIVRAHIDECAQHVVQSEAC